MIEIIRDGLSIALKKKMNPLCPTLEIVDKNGNLAGHAENPDWITHLDDLVDWLNYYHPESDK